MIRHNKILVPTDFSEQSSESLRRAVVLAKKFNAEIHLLHVMQIAAYFETDMISPLPLNDIDDDHQTRLLNELHTQAKVSAPDATVHLEESNGGVASTICEFAKTMPADLIVIGRHGEKGVLQHMLLGATVERVVAHAACSVLVTMQHDLLEE